MQPLLHVDDIEGVVEHAEFEVVVGLGVGRERSGG
jgi:hypothetical protein